MTKVWCANIECCENQNGICTMKEIHLHAKCVGQINFNNVLNCCNYQE